MKKQHEDNIDELLAKAFDDFREEPSDQVWKNVKKQMPLFAEVATSKKGFSSTKYFLISVAAIVVVASSIFLYLTNNKTETIKSVQYNSNENKNDFKTASNNNVNSKTNNDKTANNSVIAGNNSNSKHNENNVKQNIAPTENHSKTINDKPNQVVKTKNSSEQNSVKENKNNSFAINNKKSNAAPNVALTSASSNKSKTENETKATIASENSSNKLNIDQSQASVNSGNSIVTNNNNTISNDNNNSKSEEKNNNLNADQTPLSFNDYSKIEITNTKALILPKSAIINNDANNSDASQQAQCPVYRPRIYLGIHYTPELIFNLPEINSPVKIKKNNFTQSGQLSVNYDFRHLIFQTGLGYSFYSNQTTNNVKYISCDSIGYYKDVISYSMDSLNHIIYNTTPKNVYDSVKHTKYIITKNSYRYFQIPLLIGYKGYVKKFSFTIRSGVGIGILSYKKVAEVPFNVDNAELLSIETNTPALTKSYWQFLFNIGIGYEISKDISIVFEPSFKYYLSPFYENTTKHLYSVGLKTGLYFHF